MADDDYVTMQEAQRILRVGRMTLWRRVQDGTLPVYRSDRDRRVRLVKRADVEAMLTPQSAAPSRSSTDGAMKDKGDR